MHGALLLSCGCELDSFSYVYLGERVILAFGRARGSGDETKYGSFGVANGVDRWTSGFDEIDRLSAAESPGTLLSPMSHSPPITAGPLPFSFSIYSIGRMYYGRLYPPSTTISVPVT